MNQRIRETTIGANGRFLTLEDAQAYYAQFNMRLIAHENDCAQFAARAIETQAESFDGRGFHEIFAANLTPNAQKQARSEAAKRGGAAKRHYKQENCANCGGERDLGLKRALCRACYNRQKNEQYAKKKGKAA